MSHDVNAQITDGLTLANVTVLGSGPSVAIVQSELSMAQAQGILFANMVSNQQNLALSSNAAMTEGIMLLLSGDKGHGQGAAHRTALAMGAMPPPGGAGQKSGNNPPPSDENDNGDRYHDDRYYDATRDLMVR